MDPIITIAKSACEFILLPDSVINLVEVCNVVVNSVSIMFVMVDHDFALDSITTVEWWTRKTSRKCSYKTFLLDSDVHIKLLMWPLLPPLGIGYASAIKAPL